MASTPWAVAGAPPSYEPGREHGGVDAALARVAAQEDLGHRRAARLAVQSEEDVDGADCRCADGLAP